MEQISVEREYFATSMSELHDKFKQRLHDNDSKYKHKVYLKRREVKFEVGYMVLAHLRMERFPRGEYNKLKMKKIAPCKILRKFSANAYKLELSTCIGISPIFNVRDLYPYLASDKYSSVGNANSGEFSEQQYIKQMPMEETLEAEIILDIKVSKKTSGNEYLEYLVKWKDHLIEYST